MQVGDRVRVLAPFADSFPGVYTVTEVFDADGQPCAMLEDVEPGFAQIYLEVVE